MPTGAKKWLSSLDRLVSQSDRSIALDTPHPVQLDKNRLSVPLPRRAYDLTLGKQILRLEQDREISDEAPRPLPDIRIWDPTSTSQPLRLSQRLHPGDSLTIPDLERDFRYLYQLSADSSSVEVEIRHDGQCLSFRKIGGRGHATVEPVSDDARLLYHERSEGVQRWEKIVGDLGSGLNRKDALALLKEINRIKTTASSRPGGDSTETETILRFPTEKAVVLIGDLHANVDNLLTILVENDLYHGLVEDRVALLFLGDLAHSERPGELERMETSVIAMDLLFLLKRRFPTGVFFLLGNHEGFSEDVVKGEAAQGLLWKRYLLEVRGKDYVEELQRFYDRLPLIAIGDSFFACHAGPPRRKADATKLSNARQHNKLVRDLTCGRLRRTHFPDGYTAKDIKKFRKQLGIEKTRSFVVAHNPYSSDGTYWKNPAGIENHHIVYSAKEDELATLVCWGDTITPQIWRSKALSKTFGVVA
jgi:hypothetical protein